MLWRSLSSFLKAKTLKEINSLFPEGQSPEDNKLPTLKDSRLPEFFVFLNISQIFFRERSPRSTGHRVGKLRD